MRIIVPVQPSFIAVLTCGPALCLLINLMLIMKDQRQTVAIVDDHDSFRHTAAWLLTILGYQVVLEAPNGMVFLQELEACTHLPDFCLLDIEMPIMDGIVTARLVRERYPQIKIVACTLGNDAARKASMLETGVHGFLLKQMEPEEMKSAIQKALAE
jgi:DNA-binding NarL/FixJ family response regulator